MLTSTFVLETVTFSTDTGYDYPEVSGYGGDVEIKLEYHHEDDKQKSLTVSIGDYLFTPSQIEEILKEVSSYKKALAAADEELTKVEK